MSDTLKNSVRAFVYERENYSESELEEGKLYILSNFFTNCYIKAIDNHNFEITHTYGKGLEIGERYVLIEPAF